MTVGGLGRRPIAPAAAVMDPVKLRLLPPPTDDATLLLVGLIVLVAIVVADDVVVDENPLNKNPNPVPAAAFAFCCASNCFASSAARCACTRIESKLSVCLISSAS